MSGVYIYFEIKFPLLSLQSHASVHGMCEDLVPYTTCNTLH